MRLLYNDKLLDLELPLTMKMKQLLILLTVIAAAVVWPEPYRVVNDQATYTAEDVFEPGKTYAFLSTNDHILCHHEGSIVAVGDTLTDETCLVSVMILENVIMTNEGDKFMMLIPGRGTLKLMPVFPSLR